MITCYNSTKGTVDRNDQSIAHYSVRRRTSRWTMRTFHFMIDVAALNSYHLFLQVHSEEYLRQQLGTQKNQWRRLFLEKLAKELMSSEMTRRHEEFLRNGFRGCHKSLRSSFEICGLSTDRGESAPAAAAAPSSRRRCTLCSRGKDRKVNATCSECLEPTCNDHGKVICSRH
jgi:hypothetical protein